MRPETRFAEVGDVYLAYQVVGTGERAIVLAAGGPTHIEGLWDVPELAGFVDQLGRFGRVVVFDKRGVGLSDRVAEPCTVEQSADDVVGVMDAAGVEAAVLFGMDDGASVSLVAAARHPGRVRAVVALQPAPLVPPGEEWGFSVEAAARMRQQIVDGWGSGLALARVAGAQIDDPRAVSALQRLERMTGTPTSVGRWLDDLFTIDVRPYLGDVQVPVLVVRATKSWYIDGRAARWLRDQLPQARLLELESDVTGSLVAGGALLDEVEDFIAGTRVSASHRRRMLALLVTDLVGSTSTLARIGDRAWEVVLRAHRTVVREALQRYEGTEIDTAGDGFLATFRLASGAVRCAVDIREASRAAGVAVRQGVHAGEVTLLDPGIAGQAVHATARLAALAGAGEVLVSETALTLAGTGLVASEPAGTRALRGIPTRMRVHRLTSIDGAASP